ncbi:hypothetical protein [Polyangium fumosum]|uniref:Tetratricopeptide repeat protein n=1 Tax=Polyangium fumosum TaxID=889272 RepID=A0A4U1JA62_9BACT|nr:hypothetical protein [Polyangium fumosum]TKD05328.1 hypothetical protein E8A74_21260 [Polyangium fumosum]
MQSDASRSNAKGARRGMTMGAALLTALALTGCGAGVATAPVAPERNALSSHATNEPASPAAAARFQDGLLALARQEATQKHDEASCRAAAAHFTAVADSRESASIRARAHYNAGVAYQRCQLDREAREQFTKALAAEPTSHRARAELALLDFAASGGKNFDAAIAELTRAAVVDAQFKDATSLVHLGVLHLKRGREMPDADGLTDSQRAKKYAQSALAVDDRALPAYNLLALIHLGTAQRKAEAPRARGALDKKKLDTQVLELAALVCSQAIRKDPRYAPIHNTAGMIQVELGDFTAAARSFDEARRIDPAFFEAQMNFAAVNLRFRGFSPAESAYRAALALRPNDYDARIGLAHALRGQIDEGNLTQKFAEVRTELAKAKQSAPERPEAYYNEGILTQEYAAIAGGEHPELAPRKAKELFGIFLQKAGADPTYADATRRARERIEEIEQIEGFMGHDWNRTEAERKAEEAERKNRMAEEEARGAEEEAPKPATNP